jgi:hypothetical protein
LSSKIGLAGCPIHPRSLRMGGNHEPESAALVQSSTGFRRPAGDETGAGCPIHPRSLRMGGNHEPESAALVQSFTGFRRPAGDETGALASIRQLAKGQPIARAVGAKVISPALLRGESVSS